MLRASYGAFVHDGRNSRRALACQARRLAEAPGLTASELTRDGQYCPRSVHLKNSIELTGTNFRARVPLNPSFDCGWLAVRDAWELTKPSVIENFLRVFTAHQALSYRGIVLHSAGLVVSGQAYLFVGRSDAGKTTLTRKGRAAGAGVLSDDVNLVLPGAGGYEAHAVPFTGEFGRPLEQPDAWGAYPVAGLVLLEQGDGLEVEPVSASAAVARLLVACPFVNMEAAVSESLLDAVTGFVAQLPVIGLCCRREDTFDAIMSAVTDGLAYA